jgi:hypothetical protein
VTQTPGRCCGETVRVLGGVVEVCAARWTRAIAAARERYERETRRHARKAQRADPHRTRVAAMHTAYGARRR